MKYSKNVKLNKALTEIEKDLLEFVGIDDIKRYYNEFKYEVDYNIAQYGNMLIYYSDVYAFYRDCGYKSVINMSNSKIWDLYKRQVGYVVRCLVG